MCMRVYMHVCLRLRIIVVRAFLLGVYFPWLFILYAHLYARVYSTHSCILGFRVYPTINSMFRLYAHFVCAWVFSARLCYPCCFIFPFRSFSPRIRVRKRMTLCV